MVVEWNYRNLLYKNKLTCNVQLLYLSGYKMDINYLPASHVLHLHI